MLLGPCTAVGSAHGTKGTLPAGIGRMRVTMHQLRGPTLDRAMHVSAKAHVMHDTKDATEERTRNWLEAIYLSAVAAQHDARTVYDDSGQPIQMTGYHFQEVQRKLKIFRWLDRLSFTNFIDIGSGFDQYPDLVRERYGVPAYYSDFSHSMNLPYGGEEFGRLDRAITLNIGRLPFADRSFDAVLCSEVLEHLVRPIDCIAELLRITRRFLIMTSLEGLSPNRWQRWLSHFRVDVTQPHVERNFLLLDEFEAIFDAPGLHHENLFFDGTLPASSFDLIDRQAAAYATIRNVDQLVTALSTAVSIDDHRPGLWGFSSSSSPRKTCHARTPIPTRSHGG